MGNAVAIGDNAQANDGEFVVRFAAPGGACDVVLRPDGTVSWPRGWGRGEAARRAAMAMEAMFEKQAVSEEWRADVLERLSQHAGTPGTDAKRLFERALEKGRRT